jgi:hypothetical protein
MRLLLLLLEAAVEGEKIENTSTKWLEALQSFHTDIADGCMLIQERVR